MPASVLQVELVSTLDQGFACFCHAWHGASGQIIHPSAVIQLYSYTVIQLYSYTVIHTIYIHGKLNSASQFISHFSRCFLFWCRRLQTFQDLNTEA